MTIVRQGVLVLLLATITGTLAADSAGVLDRHISQRAIGGATLGMKRSGYVYKFGKPSFTTRFGNSMTRIVFNNSEFAIYLSRKGRGVAVITSAEEYRTRARVGPCSTVSALKKAYGHRLKAKRRAGRLVGFRLGRLLFTVQSTRVGAVMLANSAFPASVAVNHGQCGSGDED
jgi:hypothetical protein